MQIRTNLLAIMDLWCIYLELLCCLELYNVICSCQAKPRHRYSYWCTQNKTVKKSVHASMRHTSGLLLAYERARSGALLCAWH